MVAGGLVGDEECEPGDRKSERDEGQYAAEDERHDPAGRPAGAVGVEAAASPATTRAAAGWAGGGGDVTNSVPATLVAALVEPERRVGVGHQGGVGGDPQHPAVQPEDEVEERRG